MPSLPSKRIVLEFDNASVVYTTDHSAATGKVMPKLYIQAMDAYRYQWELTIGYRHRPGDSKDLYWEGHIYRHPGMRQIQELDARTGKGMISRILELCHDYPTLLFNANNVPQGYARHEGFIHMAVALLDGQQFSTKRLP